MEGMGVGVGADVDVWLETAEVRREFGGALFECCAELRCEVRLVRPEW
jgi:hypothetical protein